MSETTTEVTQPVRPEDIHMPPPSYWPILLALGFAILMGGLALSLAFAIVGAILILISAIGWVIEPIHPQEDTGHH